MVRTRATVQEGARTLAVVGGKGRPAGTRMVAAAGTAGWAEVRGRASSHS